VQRALLQSKTASAAIADDAGTNQFQILHMANIKELHHAGRTASGVSLTTAIELHHNDWCRANGYPIKKYRPQAGRPKNPGSKRQAPSLSSAKLKASSPRQQASSFKPRASSSWIREPRNI